MDALPMHHVAARLLGTPASIRTSAPLLGEHNRELLEELGVNNIDYETLLKSGVLAE
jgi:formyl-CoA transferase